MRAIHPDRTSLQKVRVQQAKLLPGWPMIPPTIESAVITGRHSTSRAVDPEFPGHDRSRSS
jgi:hypothetical protein